MEKDSWVWASYIGLVTLVLGFVRLIYFEKVEKITFAHDTNEYKMPPWLMRLRILGTIFAGICLIIVGLIESR